MSHRGKTESRLSDEQYAYRKYFGLKGKRIHATLCKNGGLRSYHRMVQQEERAAVQTGAIERPKEKIKIETDSASCVEITSVDLDGSQLRVYGQSNCNGPLSYLEWHWQQISPNGTVLHGGYTNSCPTPRKRGDTLECVFSEYGAPTDDDRVATLRVWTER